MSETVMGNKTIDVSDLNPKQIAMIENIIATFKSVSQQDQSSQDSVKTEAKEKAELEQLDQEFDWLVADLGVTSIYTFNENDFNWYSGIEVIVPS